MPPASRRPARGRSSPGPARAWSRTPCPPGCPRPGTGPGHRSRTGAGTAPGRSARARPGRRRPGRPRPGRSRSAPRCRCTAAARPPWRCPSSDRPSRPPPAPRPGRRNAPARSRAGHPGPRPRPRPRRDSSRCIPPGTSRRHARRSTSSSPAAAPPAAPARTPPSAAAARPGRTGPPTRSISSSNSRHQPRSTLRPAATARSSVVHTPSIIGRWPHHVQPRATTSRSTAGVLTKMNS